jgi:hypothetical protein
MCRRPAAHGAHAADGVNRREMSNRAHDVCDVVRCECEYASVTKTMPLVMCSGCCSDLTFGACPRTEADASTPF